MKSGMTNDCGQLRMFSVIFWAMMSLLLGSAGEPAASPADSATSEEAHRLGERIYREGILPPGGPLRVRAKDGPSAPGTTFACVSCHLRSGLGSFADGLYTPPASGAKLFKPLQNYSSATKAALPYWLRQMISSRNAPYNLTTTRPVYTDKSLGDALRDGVDSSGRVLNDAMPRYHLEDREMNLLISYLKSLSAEFSPGVSDTAIRFATIITEEVATEDRKAMLVPLENYIRKRNQTNFSDPRVEIRSKSASQSGANLKISLSLWVLKGPPETWRHQLEEYNRQEPVFALLGGMTNGEWRPVHQFCEENRIPCIFPITDYPVVSQSDWYTVYFSKGYYQEGEGAARFLNDQVELQGGKSLVQVVRDTLEGRALSKGFMETWRDLEQQEPVTVILKEEDKLTAEFVQQLLSQENLAAIVLWDGPGSLKALEIAAGMKNRARVLVSSSYLGKSMFALNEKVRDFTYLTYPYGISQPQDPSTTLVKVKIFNAEANSVASIRASQQSYILTLVLDMALQEMRGNYYRDHLLDVIGTIMALDAPLYDRLNFGQGQRYASKGCYIIQLAKDGLIKKIGWSTQ